MDMLILSGEAKSCPVIDGRLDGIFDGIKQSNSIVGTLPHSKRIVDNKAQMIHLYFIIIHELMQKAQITIV